MSKHGGGEERPTMKIAKHGNDIVGESELSHAHAMSSHPKLAQTVKPPCFQLLAATVGGVVVSNSAWDLARS
eukprot:2406462-Prymnesium_polylepis.1